MNPKKLVRCSHSRAWHFFLSGYLLLATTQLAHAVPVVTNLRLWTRADAGVTTSGSNVTGWADQTDTTDNTTVNNASQATTVYQPVLVANQRNTLPTLDFDSPPPVATSGDFLTFNSPATPIVGLISAGSGISIFAVAKPDVFDREIVGLRGDSNPLVQLDTSSAKVRFIVRDSNNVAASASATATISAGDWGIYGGTFTRAAAQGTSGNYTSRAFYQGATNGTAATIAGTGSLTWTDQQIGGTKNVAGGNPSLFGANWDGGISEVLIFNGEVTSSQRILIENYLSAKYDITLDTTNGAKDRYAGDAVGYDFNVIGIGRDVGATNKVSASPDNRQGLLLAELNTSLNNDNEWLLAGTKSGSNTLVVTQLPSGIGSRWSRVWNLDKTTTGALDATLTFDFSESGLAFSGTNFALLYTTNDAATFSIKSSSFTLLGDRVSFNVLDANLADGYYTLGIVPEPSSMLLLMVGAIFSYRFRRRH